ncbi:hypothetical protein, partial [Micrococcus luteus]|uniref:hypothetical protein n=1 Tax=Micrococcus luteus TaxID=1270 RepID=UPI001643021C
DVRGDVVFMEGRRRTYEEEEMLTGGMRGGRGMGGKGLKKRLRWWWSMLWGRMLVWEWWVLKRGWMMKAEEGRRDSGRGG